MQKTPKKRHHPARCPCASGDSYATCCGPFHHGGAVAETPAELMRSRYAAYAKGLVDYIVETTDPTGAAWQEPVDRWRREIRRFSRDTEFLGVEILDTSQNGDTGEVTFRARLRADGRDASFEERSTFVRRDGRWFYRAGRPYTSVSHPR